MPDTGILPEKHDLCKNLHAIKNYFYLWAQELLSVQSLSLSYSDLQFPNKNDGTIQEAGNIFVLLGGIKFSILFCNETKNVQFLNFSVNALRPRNNYREKKKFEVPWNCQMRLSQCMLNKNPILRRPEKISLQSSKI